MISYQSLLLSTTVFNDSSKHLFVYWFVFVAPNNSPKIISVLRTDNNKALNISWSAIIPNHSRGEGDMFGYEIEYRNKKIDNATIMEHVYGTWVYIEGLNGEGAYEFHVRCVVMVQSIPLPTKFERGPWSHWMLSEGEHVTAG